MALPTLPTIRILHNMSRSGGTIISKCIGCMDNIVLLSEIHPLTTSYRNPLYQAHNWFNLFSEKELAWLKNKKEINFLEAIEFISKKCIEKNKLLVIRDWSHIDFGAVPFFPTSSYELTLYNVLKKNFNIIHTATVRHPIDQWYSFTLLCINLQQKKEFKEIEFLSMDAFLFTYRKFAEYCAGMGFIKYENFTKNPEAEIKILCENLQIEYDSKFKEKWKNYKTITGDTFEISRGAGDSQIRVLARRYIEKSIYDQFKNNSDYNKAISLLGYEDYE